MEKLKIIKSSGDQVGFSAEKVATSLQRSGADPALIQEILKNIEHELHPGTSTKEIYKRAFSLLKNKNRLLASRYKLKKAIYELGPTGFPFEKFIAAILKNSGYTVEVGSIFQGKCVTHEVDIKASNSTETILIECKFHSDQGNNCNVKVPLYIHSRFRDIENFQKERKENPEYFSEFWVVINTRFTTDAIQYAKCAGLNLISWDAPKGHSLRDRIDKSGLYPITVSTILTKREKQFLLSRDVVLCKELVNDTFYLDKLEISATRKNNILTEMQNLCIGDGH